MHYVEHAVPANIQQHIQCVWELRDATPQAGVQTIYPDGRCELVAEFGVPLRFHHANGQHRDGQRLVLAGQQFGPIRLEALGNVHCLGVRLTPIASALVAGTRLVGLRNQAPDLHLLDPEFARQFDIATRRLVNAADHHPLWQLLTARCGAFALDLRLQEVIAVLDQHHGDVRIADLARRFSLGARALQMRFLATVGLTAKEYARVRRLQALLGTMRTDDEALASLAAERGFTDQSHASREVRGLTGSTPARLAKALRFEPDGDEAFRLALAFLRGRMPGMAASDA